MSSGLKPGRITKELCPDCGDKLRRTYLEERLLCKQCNEYKDGKKQSILKKVCTQLKRKWTSKKY